MIDDITAIYDMPDNWGVIQSGFQWVIFGPLNRRQRVKRGLRKIKRCICK